MFDVEHGDCVINLGLAGSGVRSFGAKQQILPDGFVRKETGVLKDIANASFVGGNIDAVARREKDPIVEADMPT